MATPTRLRSSETASRETKAAGSGPVLGEFGCLLGGVQVRTDRTFDVRSPYRRHGSRSRPPRGT